MIINSLLICMGYLNSEPIRISFLLFYLHSYISIKFLKSNIQPKVQKYQLKPNH